MKLIAEAEVWYAGRTRRPGDEFDATDQDAMILKGIGKAKDAPKAVAAKAVTPKPAEQPPPPPPPSEPAPDEPNEWRFDNPTDPGEFDPPKKRRYQRRDMIPEE